MIPVAGGTGRLIEVLGGPEVLPTDARFAASPVPLVVHIVAAVVYAVLGAFQFSARLRRRHPGWHRRAGRLLVVLGLAVAVSGLWMTLAYPQKEGTGDILWATRLLVSSGMGASLILGVVAIRQPQHRPPPRLDDPRVRARARRRHPGVHRRLRRGPLRCGRRHAPTS